MPTRVPARPSSARIAREIPGGAGVLRVQPHPDVGDGRGVPGLGDVGTAAQEHGLPSAGREHHRLEEDVAGPVVAEEVVVALLGEEDDGVESARFETRPQRGYPALELIGRKWPATHRFRHRTIPFRLPGMREYAASAASGIKRLAGSASFGAGTTGG